jgi:hemoglobin
MGEKLNKPVPTLFDWAGGQPAFEKLFTAFYKRVADDAILSPVFQHMSSAHADHVAKFVGEVFGGPKLYTDINGSHATMVAHHIGKHLTDTQRRRWITLLLETADDVGLPDDPEFRSALVGYLEWGSRIAIINSNAVENPIQPDAPMPEWGWGEVKGPYQP